MIPRNINLYAVLCFFFVGLRDVYIPQCFMFHDAAEDEVGAFILFIIYTLAHCNMPHTVVQNCTDEIHTENVL